MRSLACVFVIILVVPSVAVAKDIEGRLGVGYFDSSAPIGLRYWATSTVGIDLGFGFESIDLGSEVGTSYWIEAGVPWILYNADRANFFMRLGGVLGKLDDRIHGASDLREKWTSFDLALSPGVEVFFGDRVSLQAAHSVVMTVVWSPPSVDQDALVNVGTSEAGVSSLGFHFYF